MNGNAAIERNINVAFSLSVFPVKDEVTSDRYQLYIFIYIYVTKINVNEFS